MLEPGVGEVSQHGGFPRLLHGERMVRTPPTLGLGCVASRADLAADEFCGLVSERERRNTDQRQRYRRARHYRAHQRQKRKVPARIGPLIWTSKPKSLPPLAW